MRHWIRALLIIVVGLVSVLPPSTGVQANPDLSELTRPAERASVLAVRAGLGGVLTPDQVRSLSASLVGGASQLSALMSQQATATLTATPDYGAPGARISLAGAGYPPPHPAAVYVVWDEARVFIPTQRTNTDGSFTVPFTIPANTTNGTHTLRAVVNGTSSPTINIQVPGGAAATATHTPSPQSTGTFTPTNTPSPQATGTFTPTAPATGTPTPTNSPTVTVTPTNTTGPANNVLPPDPSTVAPPLDRSVPTNFTDATEFLYTGPNPIQTGVAPGTIERLRAAVVFGRVLLRNGNPLPGVTISILDHPELGKTLSRADGNFDLVVNGGGTLTVNYTLTGYLPAQRQVDAPWMDYVSVPDVILIPPDPQVSTVDLTANPSFLVARGSVVTDQAGTRQGTILFPQGTTAQMTLANGSTQPLNLLHVRVSEFTVGANGRQAMPADLPPNSAYTYAAALTVDEAVATGATSVTFSQPVLYYLDNFLGITIGTNVPLGYYDLTRGVWDASDDGQVLQILSITNGLADLDLRGNGQPADAALLASVGITDAERAQLATLYTPGKSLWRTRLPHFSYIDSNFPYALPGDAITPVDISPETETDGSLMCQAPPEKTSSTISCQTQVLGEEVPVAGTGLALHYSSDRGIGYNGEYRMRIPFTGSQQPPGSLAGIGVKMEVAGWTDYVEYLQTTAPGGVTFTPDMFYVSTWDGKDKLGRRVQGAQTATITVTYEYLLQYVGWGAWGVSFARVAGGGGGSGGGGGGGGGGGSVLSPSVVGAGGPQLFAYISRTWKVPIGNLDFEADGLGGWSLDPHHGYDPASRTLYLGNGERQRVDPTQELTLRTFAGGNGGGHSGDGGPATAAQIDPNGWVSVGPDGSVYFSELITTSTGFASYIRRVKPDGTITTVAGTNPAGFSGDGGPAIAAQLNQARMGPVLADGSFFIIDRFNARVRYVNKQGIISTIAGGGTGPGLGGKATSAQLGDPVAAAYDPVSQTLYISDPGRAVLRAVYPNGDTSIVAGNGLGADTGNGGYASKAGISGPQLVAVGPHGDVFITAGSLSQVVIRRIDTAGIITEYAKLPKNELPSGMWVGKDNRPLVSLVDSGRLVFVEPNGDLTVLAGGGEVQATDGPALQLKLNVGFGIGAAAGGPDGSIYLTSSTLIRRITPALPGWRIDEMAVASKDGSELYRFDGKGRHEQTYDTRTGVALYQFAYDQFGRLQTITDRDNNKLTISQASGSDRQITGPYGHKTLVTVNSLDRSATVITNPNLEQFRITTTTNTIQMASTTTFKNDLVNLPRLTALKDPRNNTSTYTYDAANLGLLIHAQSPDGMSQTLTRTNQSLGYVVERVTGGGQRALYRVERFADGTQHLNTIAPDLTETDTSIFPNGKEHTTFPTGEVSDRTPSPDQRFGMASPSLGTLTLTTPGGLITTITGDRKTTLSDPKNLLTLSTEEDTAGVNGQSGKDTYTASSHAWSGVSPGLRHATTQLDALGHVVQTQQDGLAVTQLTYDSNGRIKTITSGTGIDARTSSFAYKPISGELDTITDPEGRVQRFDYDPSGRLIVQTLPGNRQLSFDYDANGNLTGITPPGKPTYGFNYTAGNRLDKATAPAIPGLSSDTKYDYNLDRQLTQVTRPDSQLLQLGYDARGRLQVVTEPQGQLTYGYDPQSGLLKTLTSPSGVTTSLTYDGSLLTGESWNGAVTGNVTRTYDTNRRVSSQRVNSADSISFAYDADNLPLSAGALTLTRNAQPGQITSATVGNVTDTRTYNTFGEPATYRATANGTELYKVEYTRDKLGRIVTKAETIGGIPTVSEYLYYPAGQLAQVVQSGAAVASYVYDDNGNRVLATYPSVGAISGSYDAQDRLTQYGPTTYTYTTNGELTSKTLGGQVTTYAYDLLGNLVSATLPDGTQLSYLADGQNRRIGKRVNGALVQGFLYDGQLRPVAELDGNNQLVSRFVYATHVNVPDYLVKGGVTYRIITDQLGSPRLVVNTATGAIAQRMDYDEFGMVTQDTNPGFQPFGFAGGLYDRDTKLVRFGLRDYDAETGRWTAKDPIGFASADMNLYDYAFGDPMNYIDPSGTCTDLELARENKAFAFRAYGLGFLGGVLAVGAAVAAVVTAPAWITLALAGSALIVTGALLVDALDNAMMNQNAAEDKAIAQEVADYSQAAHAHGEYLRNSCDVTGCFGPAPPMPQ